MDSCLSPATAHHLYHRLRGLDCLNTSTVSPLFLASSYNYIQDAGNYLRTHSSILHFHCPLLLTASSSGRCSGRCRAGSPGPPSPPKLDPPPSSGVMSSFFKAQDAVRIFFVVLFWMSLFFWSCVWDGKNDGRPNNRSRFRR